MSHISYKENPYADAKTQQDIDFITRVLKQTNKYNLEAVNHRIEKERSINASKVLSRGIKRIHDLEQHNLITKRSRVGNTSQPPQSHFHTKPSPPLFQGKFMELYEINRIKATLFRVEGQEYRCLLYTSPSPRDA